MSPKKRKILGVIVSTLLAPYLIASYFWIEAIFSFPGPHYLSIIPFGGTILLVWFGIPILILASLGAWLATIKNITSPLKLALIGAFNGALITVSFMAMVSDFSEWPPVVMALISGALCGWVYWLIAIKEPQTAQIVQSNLHP